MGIQEPETPALPKSHVSVTVPHVFLLHCMAWLDGWIGMSWQAGSQVHNCMTQPSSPGEGSPNTYPPPGELCNSSNLRLPCKWVRDALGSAAGLPWLSSL